MIDPVPVQEFFEGDTIPFKIVITKDQLGRTVYDLIGYKITLSVKRNSEEPDSSAIILKHTSDFNIRANMAYIEIDSTPLVAGASYQLQIAAISKDGVTVTLQRRKLMPVERIIQTIL